MSARLLAHSSRIPNELHQSLSGLPYLNVVLRPFNGKLTKSRHSNKKRIPLFITPWPRVCSVLAVSVCKPLYSTLWSLGSQQADLSASCSRLRLILLPQLCCPLVSLPSGMWTDLSQKQAFQSTNRCPSQSTVSTPRT